MTASLSDMENGRGKDMFVLVVPTWRLWRRRRRQMCERLSSGSLFERLKSKFLCQKVRVSILDVNERMAVVDDGRNFIPRGRRPNLFWPLIIMC